MTGRGMITMTPRGRPGKTRPRRYQVGAHREREQSVKEIDAVVLEGALVRLEPLRADHVPGLIAAAEEDRSAFAWTSVPRAGEVAEAGVEVFGSQGGVFCR